MPLHAVLVAFDIAVYYRRFIWRFLYFESDLGRYGQAAIDRSGGNPMAINRWNQLASL